MSEAAWQHINEAQTMNSRGLTDDGTAHALVSIAISLAEISDRMAVGRPSL